jgi:hypothetical protein
VYAPPLATGENLFSTQDVENLVRFGGWRVGHDFIQIDPPQAYGIAQYARTVAMLVARGWPCTSFYPHGGNQMSLEIAAGFGLGGAESYPGVFGDFGGFADDARIANGAITLSDRPGIGFEGQSALYRIMKELAGHCVLKQRDENHLHLVLSPAQEHLFNGTQKERMQNAVRKHLGGDVRLVITVEEPEAETPAQQRDREQRERLAAAQESMENDPNVKEMLEVFDATLDKDSVQIQS